MFENNIKAVVATDPKTGDTLIILLRVLSDDPEFDLEYAVSSACRHYVQTPTGIILLQSLHGIFDWGTFDTYVPNEICRKYGFERITGDDHILEVQWDEQLLTKP